MSEGCSVCGRRTVRSGGCVLSGAHDLRTLLETFHNHCCNGVCIRVRTCVVARHGGATLSSGWVRENSLIVDDVVVNGVDIL